MFKSRIIYREDGKPYLKRFYILRTPWVRIRVHHIMLSDYDCLHDHPWNFVSIILKGSYVEAREVESGTLITNYRGMPKMTTYTYKKYNAGSILFRKAEDKHRLILQKPAWTLV